MKVLITGDFAPRARLAKQIEERKFGGCSLKIFDP